jgi:hypothetical protein
MITRPPDFLRRELGVRGLEFLKAHNAGLRFAKPVLQVLQATIDVVDIETGDLHSFNRCDRIDFGGKRSVTAS